MCTITVLRQTRETEHSAEQRGGCRFCACHPRCLCTPDASYVSSQFCHAFLGYPGIALPSLVDCILVEQGGEMSSEGRWDYSSLYTPNSLHPSLTSCVHTHKLCILQIIHLDTIKGTIPNSLACYQPPGLLHRFCNWPHTQTHTHTHCYLLVGN